LPRLCHYYEPSDSLKGIGLLFPPGYGIAYPSLFVSPTGTSPGPWVTGWHRTKKLPGPCKVSLDHFVNTLATICRNHLRRSLFLGRSFLWDRIVRITGRKRIFGFPVRERVATSAGFAPVHYSFKSAALPLPPLHPESPRRTGHRLPNFNDQSSGRTLTSLLAKLPGVPRTSPPST